MVRKTYNTLAQAALYLSDTASVCEHSRQIIEGLSEIVDSVRTKGVNSTARDKLYSVMQLIRTGRCPPPR